ncbi:alpha/beta hydrolase family protein [Galbibacter orientalis]|uniref:alpha/beta hydrolase family protein n=1 Tax=Galbibacter orientalis TaxID=453852 RepID=UPI0030809EC4
MQTKLYNIGFHNNHWLLFMVCSIAVTYCYPQYSKLKDIKPEDYDKWYAPKSYRISDDGLWVSYMLDYNGLLDTLVIKQTNGIVRYDLKACSHLEFIGKDLASCRYGKDDLKIINLGTGNKEKLSGATEIKLSSDKRFLMIFRKNKKELTIRDRIKNKSYKLNGAYSFNYNSTYNLICISISDGLEYSLQIYHLDGSAKHEILLKSQHRNILEFHWSNKNDKIVYALDSDTEDSGILGVYDLKSKKKIHIELTNVNGFPNDHKIISKREFPLRISKDGERVFFLYTPKRLQKYNNIPQVWKADEPYIYNGMTYQMQAYNTPKIGVLNIQDQKILSITDIDFPRALISPDEKYALIYDPAKYQPQARMYPPVDIYKMDLKSGKRSAFLKKHIMDLQSLNFSPSGRYVVYYKNREWWCFDTKSNLHINLNSKFNAMRKKPLFYQSPHSSYPKGWTEGEKSIFMHDEFDVWEVFVNNEHPKKLTSGREKKISYRLVNEPEVKGTQKEQMGVFLERQTLLLSMEKNTERGVAILKPNHNMTIISFGEQYLKNLNISGDGNTVTFSEERYDQPQKLMLYHIRLDTLKTLFQSNPHYKKYKSGLNQMIRYRNHNGKELSGILRYPVDYNKDSIYPMVVRVYEKQNHLLNQYKNPGLYNGTGYNLKNLVHKGYFVFLPDIEYKIGEPGYSAADCIISGTNKALDIASIDPKRIGLIGHSFGAYEALFTITQSQLFRTAIASAGVADFPREYLYLADTSVLNFNMYEYSQSRMGNSLFEDYQGYLDNSPLYHAKSIQTPLLLWCGMEDYHVNYYQSLSFHLALKRMGKKNTLLMYPEEDHIISSPENQMDLTNRVEQWLDHYLKGKPKLDWMP